MLVMDLIPGGGRGEDADALDVRMGVQRVPVIVVEYVEGSRSDVMLNTAFGLFDLAVATDAIDSFNMILVLKI